MESSSIHSFSLKDFWAKSTGESVGAHTLRVLENLRQLRERTPTLESISGASKFWPRIAVAVCLHDLGKCCNGFQALVHEQRRFPHRHEVLSAIFVRWLLTDSLQDAMWIAAAILTHHKDWPEIDQLYPPGEYDSEDGIEQLRPQMCSDFFEVAEGVAREEIWPTLVAQWAIPDAWSQRVSREWIPENCVSELRSAIEVARSVVNENGGSDGAALTGTLLRGAIILSDHSGSAWENLRVLRGLEDPGRARKKIGIPSSSHLYPHQNEIATKQGNAVLIAPTGSGKTEAALLWASRQNASTSGQPVLYYLLPYQASLNAMRQRFVKIFGDAPVTLQHSRAVQALYRQLLEKEYTPAGAERTAKRERNLASLYVKPLRISTPYQLLKGAFQLKGHEALWTAAAGALFILDEIHVYETARLAILLATLRHLCRNLSGSALVMSATLPTYLIEVLIGLLPGISIVRADAATLKEFRRHEVRLLKASLLNGQVLDRICADAGKGMGVLVVATTVGRAQQLWGELRRQLRCRVELLHGRFHADDRSKKESELLALRGVGSGSPKQGVVLVATQVVEVSLNVDFDVLYSDPAPLEALLQRFGRVNRERGYSSRTVNVCREIPEGNPVYPEHLVGKALQALECWDGKVLDEDRVQNMLDEIYDEQLGGLLRKDLQQGIERFSTDVLSTCRPFSSDERIEGLFDEMFDGHEVLPCSLKGEYERRLEDFPLLAPGLLVPITKGQYFSLKSRARLQHWKNVLIADCPYGEKGLEIYGPPSQDGV